MYPCINMECTYQCHVRVHACFPSVTEDSACGMWFELASITHKLRNGAYQSRHTYAFWREMWALNHV